jgi:hypothetical protein
MSGLLVIPSVAFGVLRAIVGDEIVAYNAVVILLTVHGVMAGYGWRVVFLPRSVE